MDKSILKQILKKFKHNEVVKIKSKKSLQYIGNFKCHTNSLSYAIKHKDKVKCIVGGVQVFTDCAVAHFVVEMKDGTYIDATYGNMAGMYESFIVVQRYKIKDFEPLKQLLDMKRTIWEQLKKSQKAEKSIDEF